MAIASDGFVFVPRCVDDQALQALRAEADSLFHLKRSKDALSEDEYFDKVHMQNDSPEVIGRFLFSLPGLYAVESSLHIRADVSLQALRVV